MAVGLVGGDLNNSAMESRLADPRTHLETAAPRPPDSPAHHGDGLTTAVEQAEIDEMSRTYQRASKPTDLWPSIAWPSEQSQRSSKANGVVLRPGGRRPRRGRNEAASVDG